MALQLNVNRMKLETNHEKRKYIQEVIFCISLATLTGLVVYQAFLYFNIAIFGWNLGLIFAPLTAGYVETYIGDIQHGHYDLHDTYCSIDVNKKLISIWGVSTNGHDIMAEYTIIKVEDTKRDGQYTTIVFLARTHMNGNIVRIILDSYYRKLSIITDSSTVVFGIGKP